MGALSEGAIRVIPRDDVAAIPLPNGSWSRMVLTGETVPGIVSSLGYSVFTSGTAIAGGSCRKRNARTSVPCTACAGVCL